MTNQPNLWDAQPSAPDPDVVPLDAYGAEPEHAEAPADYVPADYEPSAVDVAPVHVSVPGVSTYVAPTVALAPARPLVDIDSLNPAQREAVLTTEGPLLVLAGAGSGKTRVLTFRIARMIGGLGIRPWQILAITFTNKAAAEMRERLSAMLPDGGMRGMWVCTFHAMCVRILREDADLLGYTGQFTIYDDDDSRRMVREIMTQIGIEQKQYPVNMIRSKISTAKNAMIGPEEFIELSLIHISNAFCNIDGTGKICKCAFLDARVFCRHIVWFGVALLRAYAVDADAVFIDEMA